MSEYRRATDGEILTGGRVKRLHKNTSFSKVADTFSDLGWDIIGSVTRPTPTSDIKTVKRDGVEQVAGEWKQKWVEVDTFSGPTKAADEAAHIASLAAAKETGVRTDRDSRIALTDWTGMSDVTMSAEMATYRQALRDITALENFPSLETDDWPTAP